MDAGIHGGRGIRLKVDEKEKDKRKKERLIFSKEDFLLANSKLHIIEFVENLNTILYKCREGNV